MLVLSGLKKTVRHISSRWRSPQHLIHRSRGYRLLKGKGVEIGAHQFPAKLPKHCDVEYCDCVTAEQSASLFPEVDPKSFVPVDYLCDLDREPLSGVIPPGSLDFIIANHVVEHVANPIRLVEQLFTSVRKGGRVVISSPDKRYTFDRDRRLTSFEHLKQEYENNVTDISDEHYLDFLRAVHPDYFERSPEEFAEILANVRRRREHAHVWTTESFRDFLVLALDHLGINARPVFESPGNRNWFEYFSVWELGESARVLRTRHATYGKGN